MNPVQLHWDEKRTFEVTEDEQREVLPLVDASYPSGRLLIWATRNYTIGDVERSLPAHAGQNVLQPPAGTPSACRRRRGGEEQHRAGAVDVRQHRVHENQLKTLGLAMTGAVKSRPAPRNTTAGEQKFFTELYKRPGVQAVTLPLTGARTIRTVLANEQVIDGCRWRCDTKVERVKRSHVYQNHRLRRRVLRDLDKLDHWPDAP